MREFYRLLNFEFSRMIIPCLIICGLCIVGTLFLLLNKTADSSYDISLYYRFEDIYHESGSTVLFFISFFANVALFLVNFYKSYWGSKSIYTYLTLPIKRETLYFSKLVALIICLLLLLTSHLISIFIGYEMVTAKIAELSDGKAIMNNGLFLAFIRSHFFRIIFPISFLRVLSFMGVVITLLTGSFYVVLCERSKRYWGIFIAIISFIFLFIYVHMQLTNPLYAGEDMPWLTMLGILLFFSAFFIWHSIRLVKKSTLA